MSNTPKELEAQARSLSPEERAKLASCCWSRSAAVFMS